MKETKFDYTFKKMYAYIETSVLKQKDANAIQTIISNGRLKHFMEFEGYGVCEYDEADKQQIEAHVTMMDKFNRLRTNVMVFNLYRNDWNPCIYDKLFIFKTNHAKEPTLNAVFHNTRTGVSMHYTEIEYAYDILAQDISKTFNTMHKHELFKFYRTKADNAKRGKFMSETDFVKLQPIIDRYDNANWDNFDELAIAE